MLAACRYTAIMLAACRYTAIMLAACRYTAIMLAACRYTAIIRFLQEYLKYFPMTSYSVYSSVAISHNIKNSAQTSNLPKYICKNNIHILTLRKMYLYS